MGGGIRGKKPKDCFDRFTEHLNPLLNATISRNAQVRVNRFDARGELVFATTTGFIPLQTDVGRLHFSLAQALECVEDKSESANRRWRLSTRAYWYRLQRTEETQDQALIRWEYAAPTFPLSSDNLYCWRHVQVEAKVAIDASTHMDLNHLHTPSGYVVIEDVFRYLINDLGVKPQKPNWSERLLASEKVFTSSFNQR